MEAFMYQVREHFAESNKWPDREFLGFSKSRVRQY
jgi:hypothetical protein